MQSYTYGNQWYYYCCGIRRKCILHFSKLLTFSMLHLRWWHCHQYSRIWSTVQQICQLMIIPLFHSQTHAKLHPVFWPLADTAVISSSLHNPYKLLYFHHISNQLISESHSCLYVSHMQNWLGQGNKKLPKRKHQEQSMHPCIWMVWARTDLFPEKGDSSNMTFS